MFLWTFPPYRYVGGELMTIELLKYLRARGHEITVYAKQIPKSYEYEGFKVERSVYIRRDTARDYDVFLTHAEIRVSVMSLVRALPYVSIIHNVAGPTLRSLERQPPTLTIVNSKYTETHVPTVAREHGLGVHVITPPTIIEPLDGPRDRYGIVNMSIEKGGDVFRYVAERNPTLKFLGVTGGHGVQVDNYPRNVERQSQTNDMRPVYARMKALLFPTRSETYGMVAGEAMQFGIPVIGSDIAAVREVCGDGALLLDPDNYELWSDAVRDLERPDHYKKMSIASAERGKVLRARSLSDMERFESLVIDASKIRPL